jgi:hypothetical protein
VAALKALGEMEVQCVDMAHFDTDGTRLLAIARNRTARTHRRARLDLRG